MNAISDVSLNQLTPESLLDLSFPSRALLPHSVLQSCSIRYVGFSVLFWSGCAIPEDSKNHTGEGVCVCLCCGGREYLRCVGAFGAQSATSHSCWWNTVVAFYLLSSTIFSISYRKPQHLQARLCSILRSQNLLSSSSVKMHKYKIMKTYTRGTF